MKKLIAIIIYLTVIGLVVWYAPDMAIWLTQFTVKQILISISIIGAILFCIGVWYRVDKKFEGDS